MPRLLPACALLPCALLLIAVPAWADYRSGVAAWGRGDYTAAAGAFRPAAEAGDAESQYMMGRLYSLGDGVPRDFVQSWLWFDRAARQGHAEAAVAREALDHVLNAGQMALAQELSQPPPPDIPVPAPSVPAAVAQVPAGRPVLLLPRHGGVAGID